jgi:hypothetical protein
VCSRHNKPPTHTEQVVPRCGQSWLCNRSVVVALAVGGTEMSALLTPDVMNLVVNGAVRPIVRKKAALALLRLLRKSTNDVEELLQPEVGFTLSIRLPV